VKRLIILFLLVSAIASADDLQIANKGQVSFVAVGKPSFLKINAKGSAATGALQLNQGAVSGNLEFDLTTLQSGISLRDEHMKEKYLEVGKYPKATLAIDKLAVPASFLASGTAATIPFEGTLTLHGVSKKVSGQADLSKVGSEMIALANFPLKLSDFKIDVPKYAGITVADEVKVNAEVHAAQNTKTVQ
jgi:polyisoprenoid-binding protein YceI